MATFALIHGGGSSAWDWHLVTPLLQERGHEVIAVDLPIHDDAAELDDYVHAVTAAVGTRSHVIVVGHSLGGFTAPLVADALHADGLVYIAGMIPQPGEAFTDWWTNTGHDRETISDDPDVTFFGGVSEPLARQAHAHARDQQGAWMSRPWPADRYPAVLTRAFLCRDDQFFPAAFMARQIRDRLGIEPVEIAGGHYALISQAGAVAAALHDVALEVDSLD